MAVIATRRERVILDLSTNFPEEAAKAAAAVALLNEEIKHLGGKSGSSPLKTAAKDIEDVGRRADRSGPSIDKLSGRVNLLAKGFAVLGPSLIPIGAVAVPAIAGLASQFGFAAIAGGTAIAAFQGVGDALKAMNDAALEPTAAHLLAARDAMAQISPQAQQFVRELRSLQPELSKLRDTAAAGLFPGLTEGLDQMSSALPAIERIVGAVAGELGQIASGAGASLGGARWADFFTFLQQEAPHALAQMADGVGNVAHAMAELWMSFAPLNHGFSDWLLKATADLDKWASGLAKTQGFQEFVDYIQTNGPQVASTMGAIANAVLQIVEAAAPIGGPVLKGIEGLANAIAKIADSDIGTPLFSMIAAFSALNLAMTAAGKVQTGFVGTQGRLTTSFEKQRTSLRSLAADYAAIQRNNKNPQTIFAVGGNGQAEQISAVARETEKVKTAFRDTAVNAGKAGAFVAAFAAQSTGLGHKLGVSNTVMLAMAGSVLPGYGTAIGAAVGATIDLSHSTDNVTASVTAMQAAMRTGDIDAMNTSLATFAKNAKDAYGFDLTSTSGPSLGKLLFGIGPQQGLNVAKDALTGKLQQAKSQSKDLNASLNADASDRAVESLVHSLGLLPSSFHLAGSTAAEAGAKLIAAREAARTTGQSFVGLGQSLNDSKTSLNGWIHDMAASAAALRQFTANSLIAANRGLRQGLISALQQAGPEGAKRMKQLADGTDGQIKRANRAWGAGKAAVRGYTDAIGGVPGSKSTKISAPGTPQARAQIKAMRDEIARLKDKSVHMDEKGSAAARARIAALRAAIASLHDKTVNIGINTHRNTSGGNAPGGGATRTPAAGGQMRAMFPGETQGPTDDTIPAMLSHREWVMPVSAVDYYGESFMSAVQAGAYAAGGQVLGLAAGGQAKHSTGHHNKHKPTKSNSLQHAIDKLTAAVENETSARDDLVSKRNDLASTVGGNFLSDPFAAPDNSKLPGGIWAAGASMVSDPIAILKKDAANAKQFETQLKQLRKNGVSGQALAAIASTGDSKAASNLLSLGVTGDKQYTSLYNQRAAAANAVGAYTGNSVYGAAIAKDNAELVQIKLELKKLNAEQKQRHDDNKKDRAKNTAAHTKGINHAAAAGAKKKAGR